MFFVSMMDKEHADFDKVFAGHQRPVGLQRDPRRSADGPGDEFRGIINCSVRGPISSSPGR